MHEKLVKITQTLHPAQLSKLATFLLKDEAISGKFILAATALALFAANSFLSSAYESLWATNLSLGLGDWSLHLTLQEWVNEGLMTFFFLVVGLELKRELVHGELRKFRTAALPFAAAIGGMAVPALIYASINFGKDTASGWAIPTATDIALAIGLLALLGRRIPSSIRLFLLTLAIVDDILAVIVITVFYNTSVQIPALLLAAAIVAAMLMVQKARRMNMFLFVLFGVSLWLAFQASGVEPSIVGVLLGLLAPLALMGKQQESIAERAERAVIPFSTLVVVPVFAFANTGIVLATESLHGEAAADISLGIILGLVVGKFVGISLVTWLMVRASLARLPTGSNWRHIMGVGLLAGIGFTVAIFVTELAFENEAYITTAKISIFVASILSAILGLLLLRFTKSKHLDTPELQ